jgi:hypothetical protein
MMGAALPRLPLVSPEGQRVDGIATSDHKIRVNIDRKARSGPEVMNLLEIAENDRTIDSSIITVVLCNGARV